MKHLKEKLIALEKPKDQIDVNNNALDRTNLLLIMKMAKKDYQMDEAAKYVIDARKVRGDILHYNKRLAETNAFLAKIENHNFTFLPSTRDMVEEKD